MKLLIVSVIVAAVFVPFTIVAAESSTGTEDLAVEKNDDETIGGPEEELVVVNGPMSCGNLACPAGTTICRISSETDEDDPSSVVHTSQCLDKKRNVLDEDTVYAVNRSGRPVKGVSESTNTGSSYHCINCDGNPTPDDMKRASRESFLEAQRIQKRIQDNIYNTMRLGFGGAYGMGGYGMGGYGMGGYGHGKGGYGVPYYPYWY